MSLQASFADEDELAHTGLVDEWVFATWTADAQLGVVSGHRLLGKRAWYWCALVQADQPLLHLAEWQVLVRDIDPFIVKAPEMWAEHQLDEPLRQWSIGNEAYFVALDDPDDALDRAYGTPTATAMDLEWYAVDEPIAIADGFEQSGVVHGEIELLHRPNLEFTEAPAHRWRRWGPTLGPLFTTTEPWPPAQNTAGRAPFRFPDGPIVEWTLDPHGWAAHRRF